MFESILHMFPMEMREFFREAASREGTLSEIRLRARRPVMLLEGEREWYLDGRGRITDKPELAERISPEQLEEILQHLCHYSLYAFEEELRQGFVTVAGGHRVGLVGQAVLGEDGEVRTLKHICGMNIRIAHEVKGAADGVLPWLYRQGQVKNTLILSPPGCGKTTLLRDLIRQISRGNAYGRGQKVGVVDERSEIAGCFLGQPQNDVGPRTDVLDACPKVLGMRMLLRSMSPQVIAIDELGSRQELEALHEAAAGGVRILATLHGDGLKDLTSRAARDRALWQGLFDCVVVLGRDREGRFTSRSYHQGEWEG